MTFIITLIVIDFSWFCSFIVSSFLNSFSDIKKIIIFPFFQLDYTVHHCKHNVFGSFSGYEVIKTMHISHWWSSQTNYFSLQNKYLSNCIPIKSSSYTLKRWIFWIYYLKTVYYRCSSFNVYVENDKVAESHKDRQNIIYFLNIYNTVFVFYCQSYVKRITLKD